MSVKTVLPDGGPMDFDPAQLRENQKRRTRVTVGTYLIHAGVLSAIYFGAGKVSKKHRKKYTAIGAGIYGLSLINFSGTHSYVYRFVNRHL